MEWRGNGEGVVFIGERRERGTPLALKDEDMCPQRWHNPGLPSPGCGTRILNYQPDAINTSLMVYAKHQAITLHTVPLGTTSIRDLPGTRP
ncbi:hypothetical protein Taro_017775 [Colocasia esculenta]|uniref:Uncharacterized protein n=1 Tax=Colocasia esculenta TaxID=4460 RepID=A0A843UP23_COLES|nr:hypothetical protein [Colocasia esculenta]